MRPTGRLLRAMLAFTRRQRPRRYCRKLRNRPVERTWRSEAKPAQLASPSFRAAHCWSSTATHSPIDRITRCRKPFAAAMASAGAILGFANFLLRFYAGERPRAVIVGWDSLDAPTKRHEMFPAYQSGRVFDEELIEQLAGRGNRAHRARRGPGYDMGSIQTRFRTSSRSEVTLLTNCLAPPESDQNAPLNCCDDTARLRGSLRPVSFKHRLRCSASIG
jgi:hypothetical protein